MFRARGNYTFSKTLGDEEGDDEFLESSLRNGRDRRYDRRPLGFGVGHVFRNSGTYEVPFGHFQFGVILNVFSGRPLSLFTGVSSFNQNQLLTGLRFRPIRAEFIGSRIPRSSHGMRLSR